MVITEKKYVLAYTAEDIHLHRWTSSNKLHFHAIVSRHLLVISLEEK